MKTNLETIPIFIKAGSFIPMVPAVNSTDDYSSEKMTIRYYMDEKEDFNTSMMYEDDGEIFRSAVAETGYELLDFSSISNDEMELFSFSSANYDASLNYSERHINFEIIGLSSMSFDKIQMEDAFGLNSLVSPKNNNETSTWYLKNDDAGVLHIEFDWEMNTSISISIHK
jgi:oligosaccharide 4-alpha-D-glucosyltransferase